ncbi:hypothetical protein [Mesorhizobium sp. M0276]|uniref:hypothetical protein n=1 Tax=Mesorhizobium sp. M0276 TaxID=2956928 RepID=UPI00333B6B01
MSFQKGLHRVQIVDEEHKPSRSDALRVVVSLEMSKFGLYRPQLEASVLDFQRLHLLGAIIKETLLVSTARCAVGRFPVVVASFRHPS